MSNAPTTARDAGMTIAPAPAVAEPQPYANEGDLFDGEADALAAALAEARSEAPPPKPAPAKEAKTKPAPEEPKPETAAKEPAKAEEKTEEASAEEAKTEPEAEPAKEPAKPEEPLGAARASLARRTAKFEAERTAWRSEQASREQTFQAREAQLRAQEQTLQHAQNVIAEARRDPLGFLAQLGITAEHLNRRILNDGRPSAEETAEVARREAAQALEEARRLHQQTVAAQQRAQTEAQVQAVERAFVAAARAKDAYPTLAAIYTDAELLREGRQVGADAKAATGQAYSDKDILDYLEDREIKRYGRVTGKQASGPGGANGAANGSGSQGLRAGVTSGPTLTNRTNAQRATLPKPIEEMDEDEERAYLLKVASDARASR